AEDVVLVEIGPRMRLHVVARRKEPVSDASDLAGDEARLLRLPETDRDVRLPPGQAHRLIARRQLEGNVGVHATEVTEPPAEEPPGERLDRRDPYRSRGRTIARLDLQVERVRRLERRDPTSHGSLIEAKFTRRCGEAAIPGHGEEDPQVRPVEHLGRMVV